MYVHEQFETIVKRFMKLHNHLI